MSHVDETRKALAIADDLLGALPFVFCIDVVDELKWKDELMKLRGALLEELHRGERMLEKETQ